MWATIQDGHPHPAHASRVIFSVVRKVRMLLSVNLRSKSLETPLDWRLDISKPLYNRHQVTWDPGSNENSW